MSNMKKLCNFFFQLLAICGFVAGIYYLYKKYFQNTANTTEGNEEELDFDFNDEDFTETVSDSREYVTLNSSESKSIQNSQEDADADLA